MDDEHSRRVLYVDDEAANLMTVQYALDGAIDVEVATSAEEALERLANEDFAVLLTDQRMPGMTGVELCALARERYPDTVRIILTAYADLHAAVDAVNRGQVMRYLSKPIADAELEAVLRTAIDAYRATRLMRELQERALRSSDSAAFARQVAETLSRRVQRLRAELDAAEDLRLAALRAEGARRSALLDELGHVHASAQRELAATDEILDQLEGGLLPRDARVASVDVARVADSVVRLVRARAPANVSVGFENLGAPRTSVDAETLSRALLAVLDRCMAEADAAPRRVVVRVSIADQVARLEVADDGPPLEPAAIERAFDPWVKIRGVAGADLAASHAALAQHGGSLRVGGDSGLRFEFALPLAGAARAEATARSTKDPGRGTESS